MTRIAWKRLAILVGILALVCCMTDCVSACPTCKNGFEHDGASMAMARGYFWSILFMISMPFLILGGLSTYFYLEIRKARRLQLATGIPGQNVGSRTSQVAPSS